MSERSTLPNGWTRAALGTLGSFTNGINKGAEDFGFGVPFVNLLDVFGKTVIDDYPAGLVNATRSEVERYSLEEGDVIFIRSSVKPAGVGLTALVERAIENTVYSGFLIRFRPYADHFETAFLRYCFHNGEFRRQLISKSTVSANTNINQVSLRQLEIKFPAVPQQRRIAEILGTVDEAIEQTEALVAKYQQLKAGLMHDLFTRGVTPDGQLRPTRQAAPHLYQQSPLGWIPKEWEVKPCSEICVKITVGIVVRPTQYYVSEGVPAFRSANVRETGLDPSDLVFISPQANALLAKSQLQAGDVVSVRTGYPGTSAVVPEWFAGANCIDLLISRPTPEVRSHFLANWINSSFGKNQVLQKQGGLAQQHFNVGELRTLLVIIPKLPEQDAMVAKLDSISTRIESEQELVAKLRAQKQGLMQDLLTGRVRVEPPTH